MTEETAGLVREIRDRCRTVVSLVGTFEAAHHLHPMPLETRGRFSFRSPDKARSESITNRSEIITVRNGSRVERRLPGRKEVWKYDLKELPQALALSYPVADFWDPFSAADEESLSYTGQELLGDLLVRRFVASPRTGARAGTLDTRKGFSIPYRSGAAFVQMCLYVCAESGLLRRLIATGSGGREVARVDYFIEGINVPLDESLFALDQSSAAYRSIDITDTLLAALNPDSADGEPSVN